MNLNNYPGNKARSPLRQMIINVIRPHTVFSEPAAGSAGITRVKKPAEFNYLNDLNPDVVKELKSYVSYSSLRHLEFTRMHAIDHMSTILSLHADSKGSNPKGYGIVFYIDYPYIMSTRQSQSLLYECEASDQDHKELLDFVLTTLSRYPGVDFILSNYDNELYNNELAGWGTRQINTNVHGKIVTEKIWFNYNVIKQLHEYTYVGKDRTDRQRIKRKVTRILNTLEGLPPVERNAILDELRSIFGDNM